MSEAKIKQNMFERRAYPRTKANCSVHYFNQEAGSWNKATLEDYSAGGICFQCDELVVEDTKITVQITRDAHPSVPAIAASAVVMRCEVNEGSQYKIACKLTRVRAENKEKNSYLWR